MQYTLSLIFLLLGCSLAAQTIQQRLDWQQAETVEWEGHRRAVLTYQLGGAAGGSRSGEVPPFVQTFRVGSGTNQRVEVVRLQSEPFTPPAAFDAEVPESFTFAYGVSQQPEGWLGKVSGPTIIRTSAGSYERLTEVELRLTSTRGASTRGPAQFATSSILREGEVYRFAVPTTGMYKLTRAFLTDQLRVNGLDGVDPRDIKVYGQVGGMLPETNNELLFDDLTEQAIQIEGEDDGSFDGGDYILLYAEGPDRRSYDPGSDRFGYEKNIYTDRNYYFLQLGTGGRGRRVSPLPAASGGTVVDSYDALYRFEEDRENILHELGGNSHGSGKEWFGEFLRANRTQRFSDFATIPDLVTTEPATLRARMALRSSAASRFFVEVDGQELSSNTVSRINFGAQEQSAAANIAELTGTVALTDERVSIEVNYPVPAGADRSEGWLDWVELRARRQLSFGGQTQFTFRDTRSRDASSVSFQLLDPPSDVQVWRVDSSEAQSANLQNGRFTAAAGGRLYEYVAFRSGASLLSPEAIGRVEPQNLHGVAAADMIIVTHPDFLVQAEQLAAHRRSHNGYRVALVTTQQVYNEFSSGRDDPAAIRNFARMVYDRDPAALRYLLLFGDGSFDHRNIYGLGDNFIPTYQYQGAFTEVRSFPADDFFGIMADAVAGQPLGPDLSVAVGRLPVKSADEAGPVVDKLIRYDIDPSSLGDWRTRMVFVGDDEDGGRHTIDVNRVANAVQARKPDLNFDKLYFDLFPQLSFSAGDRYPAITEGLDRAVFRGALAVTYLGHGGPRGWAQERVLTIPQIRNWNQPENSPDPIQPPVFITATCTFSNYDDASFVSAGEEALLTPRGGVIALMTTTRPVFATRNYELTDNTVQAMLDRPNGEWRSLGDIIRIAKNETTPADRSFLDGDTQNARKFTLLGDPATVIALPTHGVRTTMIDSSVIDSVRYDTVRALQQMRIAGEIVDVNGNLLDDFNGEVFPTIYDKAQTIPTLQQDGDSPLLNIEVQRSIVFRGRATVTNGKFSFEFVVPNDIDYTFGPGKVSYYASDRSQFTDAAGFYDRLIIGGTNPGAVDNDEGPEVEVYLNNTDFITGGEVSEDPVLLLHLSDDLGINVTGNSIGHDLEAVIDGDTRNAIVLNDYYEADVDNFRAGKVRYPLFDLEPGPHTLSVRAWDVANNNTVATTDFVVTDDRGATLSHVLNYPNPFTQQTCFQFDHTLVGQNVEALVQIYTVGGRLVKTLEKGFDVSDGSIRQDDCIPWDGLDDYGDQLARGVYLYQVRLRGDGVNVVDGELEKLVILR